jgi:hypothetical protein
MLPMNVFPCVFFFTKNLFCETVFVFFIDTYYVGIAVIARWPASGISSELINN